MAAKGKGRKRTPQEFGFEAKDHLYVRELQTKGVPFRSGLEIGNLQRPALLSGYAVDVLCSRQCMLGNPFRLEDPFDDCARDMVCDAFEGFLQQALMPEMMCSLMEIAEATAKDLGLPQDIIGKDWAREFGSASCEQFREAFDDLRDLFRDHGSIRLLCHCAPKRCHAQCLARLCNAAPSRPTDTTCKALISAPRRWAKAQMMKPIVTSMEQSLSLDGGKDIEILKERRKIQKALRDITVLEERTAKGEQLLKEQVLKMSKKADYVDQLNKLTGW